jgi:NAD(P)-dependent dehydrogenase (short-subunit alcohol dehydrogenase family)
VGEFRFDGRTAIVTGAGGNPSLGRAHAMLLASRGANVIVNDIGKDPGAHGYEGSASAETVAGEIRALGGKAVADTNSVATEEGAAAIVKSALDAFGRLDILVNNAGLCINVAFDELSSAHFQRTIDVNLMGPIWMCRAAWPHMRRQAYGRIVNITSPSLAGNALQAAYATSKGGLLSLTRSLADEGQQFGIKANCVNPGAYTRMVKASQDESCEVLKFTKEHMPAEVVSPAVAFLAHEHCPVTGECIESMGGKVSRVYLAQTDGFADTNLTIETIASQWDTVMNGAVGNVLPIGMLQLQSGAYHFRPYKP